MKIIILLIVVKLTIIPLFAIPVTSNLGEASTGGFGVTDTIWVGNSFTVDNQNYTLDQITVNVLASAGSNFFLSVYDNNSGAPGSELERLTGSDTPPTGNVSYTSSSLSLLANTDYWVVWGLSDSASGIPVFDTTASDNQTGTWLIGDGNISSFNGGTTWTNPASDSLLFEIDVVNPVPEPSTYALLLLLGLGFLLYHRKIA